MTDATLDMQDWVKPKGKNGDYNTVAIDLMALPIKVDGEYSRIWIDGVEIRNVLMLNIEARAGAITEVTVSFNANVRDIESGSAPQDSPKPKPPMRPTPNMPEG